MSKRPQPIEKRYINVYSQLTPQEWRQLRCKERYKDEHPEWDDSTIIALSALRHAIGSKTNLTALDAGCGRGNYLLDETRNAFSYVEGVDIEQASVEGNRTCNHITIASLESVPLPSSEHDIVTMLWVLEHLADPKKVVREMFRLLKSGGSLIAITPNAESLLLRIKRIFSQQLVYTINRRWYGREEQDVFPTQYRANSQKKLVQILTEAGFTSVRVEYNEDPSYTSWNQLTYFFTTVFFRLFRKHIPSWACSHLVITAQK
jgi:ubiquinone/menaquinone biosynthesis C-methylase UbiE